MVVEDESRAHTDRHPDINSELDELDREEFYRLKKVRRHQRAVRQTLITSSKVSNKKQRDQAAQDAQLKAKRAEEREKGGSDKENEAEAPDVLGENEDEDVIF